MKPENIIITVLLVALSLLFIFRPFKESAPSEKKQPFIDDLSELFPSKETTQIFKQGIKKYEVKVNNIVTAANYKSVDTVYDVKEEDGTKTIYTTYIIEDNKVIKTDRHMKNGDIIEYTNPTEIIVGLPEENMTWTNEGTLTTYKVTDISNNQVTIESVRNIDVSTEEQEEPIQKEYKEKMVFEKGKGMIFFRSEVVDYPNSVYEIKLVK